MNTNAPCPSLRAPTLSRRDMMRCLICGAPALPNGAHCAEHVPTLCPYCGLPCPIGEHCPHCHQLSRPAFDALVEDALANCLWDAQDWDQTLAAGLERVRGCA